MKGAKKGLSAWQVFAMASGAMISSGLFVLPSLAFAKAGSGMIVSYGLAGLFMVPALFARLELSTALPKSGGLYFLLERILGTGPGLLAGMTGWLMIVLKSSLALVGIEAFVLFMQPETSQTVLKLVALGTLLFFTVVNLVSIEHAGNVQTFLVVLLLAIIGIFIGIGYPQAEWTRVRESFKPDALAIVSTAALVFISYGGISKIANVAEEIDKPGTTLVTGIMSAFIVVQLLYILAVAVLVGVLEGETLSKAALPLSTAAGAMVDLRIASGIFSFVLAIGGILAFLTTANAGLLSASRIPFAMARDNLLPSLLSRVSERRGIPSASVLFTSLAMAASLLFLDLEQLAKIASGFMLIQFALELVAILVVRKLPSRNYRPTFRIPFYGTVSILGILLYLALLVALGPLPLAVVGAFTALSLIWYFLYSRKNARKDFALAKILSGIAGKDLLPHDDPLENEMLDILLKREQIEEDRVDGLIREASVIRLSESVQRDRLFAMLAAAVAPRWSMEAAEIERLLEEREKAVPTILYPGVALPHAILPGTNRFELVLVRCADGLIWDDAKPPVRTVFGLFGTMDERTFHLQCLAAIAQTLQDHSFMTRWESARDDQELKNALLLTRRKRWIPLQNPL